MAPSESGQWLMVTGRRPSDPRPRHGDRGPGRPRWRTARSELPGGLGGNQVADTGEDLQRCQRHHPQGRLRHLERNLGVLLAPDQVDRAADGRHVVRVVLRQQPHEHVAHHPLRGPVVGGPVPVPHGFHPALTEQAHPVEPADGAVGHRRPGAALALDQGDPAQHQPLDPVGDQCAQPDGNPPPERVADQHHPFGQDGRVVEQREQVVGILDPTPTPPEAQEWPRTRTGRGRWRSPSVPCLRNHQKREQSPRGSAATRGGRARWAPPTPIPRRTGDRRRTTSAPAHPTDSLGFRGTIRPVGDRAAPGRGRTNRLPWAVPMPSNGRWARSPSRSAVPSTRRPPRSASSPEQGRARPACSLFGPPDASGRVRPMPITRPSAHSPAKRPANCASDSTTTACWCPRPPAPGAHPAPASVPERSISWR